MLSKIAQNFADEIRNHDWSDAPFRIDRAGHRRDTDGAKRTQQQLDPEQTDRVRMNVIWVVAQQLASVDPNFDPHEFADAAGGIPRVIRRSDGSRSNAMWNGLRVDDFEIPRGTHL